MAHRIWQIHHQKGAAKIRILKPGSRGPLVELLQLALNRALSAALVTDGVFGSATQEALRRFQSAASLPADGIVGSLTHRALLPWYTGFAAHTVKTGDSLYRIAEQYGSSLAALDAANPEVEAGWLIPGTQLVVPLPFPVVPTAISWCSALVGYVLRGLSARYPFLSVGEIGKSVMGRPLWRLGVGSGDNRVIYTACHHANEWICTPLVLRFTEELCEAYVKGGGIYGRSAGEILGYSRIHIIPALNPDGMDLVTGELSEGDYYRRAQSITAGYPSLRFPQDWKANIQGIDLNLQYPAGWEQARANKFALGYTSPAPAEFVGCAPLIASESRALYDFTLSLEPALILAFHTQGQVIYWRYADYEPPGAAQIGAELARASGYTLEDTPYSSGFAGYKDWFIQNYNRPGYTVEAGIGQNPLPIEQFEAIYRDNIGILTLGALLS